MRGPQALEQGQSTSLRTRTRRKRGSAFEGSTDAGDGVAGNVGVDVGAPRADHGPDAVAAAGGEHGQVADVASAAHETHDDGLGAVVGVMPCSDTLGAIFGRMPKPLKAAPASGARAGLQVTSGLDRDARSVEGHIERARKALGAVELRPCLGAQPMVHAMCEQAEGDALSELAEHVKQRHRVGATAHGHQNGRAARHEAGVADGCPRTSVMSEGGWVRGMVAGLRNQASSKALQSSRCVRLRASRRGAASNDSEHEAVEASKSTQSSQAKRKANFSASSRSCVDTRPHARSTGTLDLAFMGRAAPAARARSRN